VPRPGPSLSAALVAATLLAGVSDADAATRAYVGVYLHDVTRFDQKDGQFEVDLELWVKWRGELDPEAIRIANGASLERESLGSEAEDGWNARRWRVRGTLRGEFPLHRFPFDAQTLAVRLELPAQVGELVPDLAASGMSEHFSVTGWSYDPEFRPRAQRVRYPSDLGSIATEGLPTTVSTVSFEVTVHRPFFPVTMKLFLPLGIICLVGLVALFLHPDQIEPRASIGVTALLSCFAFQFVVADTMPDVAYLTFADRLFIGAYAFGAVGLLQSVLAYGLNRGGRGRVAIWLDRTLRLLLPAGAGAALILLMPRTVATAALPPEPLPRAETPATARGVVRVGTNLLATLLGAPTYRATAWGLTHTDATGVRRAFLAEAAPGVASRSMRLLAGGQLVVTWRLREGARWSDGTPIDADDLRFAVLVSPDPRVLFTAKKDARTLAIRYDRPVAQALEGFTPLPRKALEPTFRARGHDAVRDLRRGSPMLSTGPYKVVEFVARERLVIEANPHFLGAAPAIQRVEVVFQPDSAALVAAFERGEIDITVPNAITPDDARALAARRPHVVRMRPAPIQSFLHPDLDNPVLAKRTVRRAILHAIDRARIARELYGDAGRVSDAPTPGEPPAGTVGHAYDPAEAQRLLAEAGATGAALLLQHGASPLDRQIAEIVEQGLEAAGLVVDRREVLDAAELYRGRRHGGLLLHVRRSDPDDDPLTVWNVPLVSGHYDRAARSDAFDEGILALVQREEQALYAERRAQLRAVLAAAYSVRLPLLPLVFGNERVLADPALRGWDTGPDVAFGENLHEWFFAPTPAP
jgi:peptide/nickel transport system substrate-binding protein